MNDISCKDTSGERVMFLVGAGRSGTTLLYKLLCLHPGLAYLSNYDNRFPWLFPGFMTRMVANRTGAKLNAWFSQGGSAYFIKRPLVKRLFPTPVEGESVYESCGMPLFPSDGYQPDERTIKCLCMRFDRVRRAMKADIILSKRTANNRRLPQLKSIFPNARYVHLIRDGREVAHSLSRVEWWDQHVLWWDGRTAAELEKTGEDRLAICAKNWVYEMKELYSGLSAIDPTRVFEVRYEQMLANPVKQLESILDYLGLPLTSAYQRAIESLQLAGRPGAWSSAWTPEQLESVLHVEQPLLDELGYL